MQSCKHAVRTNFNCALPAVMMPRRLQTKKKDRIHEQEVVRQRSAVQTKFNNSVADSLKGKCAYYYNQTQKMFRKLMVINVRWRNNTTDYFHMKEVFEFVVVGIRQSK